MDFFRRTLDGRLNALKSWILGLQMMYLQDLHSIKLIKNFARANGCAARDKPFILLQVRPIFRGFRCWFQVISYQSFSPTPWWETS